MIHPFNDSRIVAGQSTAAQELLEEVADLEVILAPVGGGGLLSGCALAAHHYSPATRVVGTEPAAADDAARSLAAGRILPAVPPATIADGLLTSLGELTFAIIRDHVERIVTVDEAAIVEAMRAVWERMKILIEPSSAVPVAAPQLPRCGPHVSPWIRRTSSPLRRDPVSCSSSSVAVPRSTSS